MFKGDLILSVCIFTLQRIINTDGCYITTILTNKPNTASTVPTTEASKVTLPSISASSMPTVSSFEPTLTVIPTTTVAPIKVPTSEPIAVSSSSLSTTASSASLRPTTLSLPSEPTMKKSPLPFSEDPVLGATLALLRTTSKDVRTPPLPTEVHADCEDHIDYCPTYENYCIYPETGMRDRCRKTCRICAKCKNYRDDCNHFRSQWLDYCMSSTFNVDCQILCKLCDLGCRNRLPTFRCNEFKKLKGCGSWYMRQVCKVTCGVCTPDCRDVLNPLQCRYLKSRGFCEDYGENDYAHQYCRRTCDKCV